MTTDGTLKALSWSGGLVAVEPQPELTFEESAPDAEALRRKAEEEVAAATSRRSAAEAVLGQLGPLVRRSELAVVAAVLLGLALLIGLAAGGISFDSEEESSGAAQTLAAALLMGPLLGTLALAAWYRIRRTGKRFGFWKGAATFMAASVVGVITLGAGCVLFPLGVGLLGLRSRPLLNLPDGSQFQVQPSAYQAYKSQREIVRDAKRTAADAAAVADQNLATATTEYEERRKRFEEELKQRSPFVPVGPLSEQDLLVVGGTAPERGDLVHNLTAAWTNAGPVWILDLHADGAAASAYEEATEAGRTVGVVDASVADGIVALLDQIAGPDQPTSRLIEVLSAGMAASATSGSAARKREIADTLSRIARALESERPTVQVADLHLAMEALLSGRTASGRGADDFGLRGEEGEQTNRPRRLSADETRRLREAFTDDERTSYFREWSEIRTQLSRLVEGLSENPAEFRWGSGWDVSLCFLSADLPRDDRELRSALLAEHHIQMIRQESAGLPACLIVLGCDEMTEEGLRELSRVGDANAVALVMVFNDLTPVYRQFARGRRALAAFGGLGAEAAEELSNAFGHEWTRRIQSYQDTWSESLAQSRSVTSGRSWNDSESQSRTRGRNWGSSHSTGEGGSSSSSRSSGRSDSTTESTSQTRGESESETDGSTSTEGRSRAATESVQYEQAVRGAEIAHLPPFTMLLKVGSEVKVVDVKRDLELPEGFLAQFRPFTVERHRPKTVSAEPPRPPRPEPPGLPSPR